MKDLSNNDAGDELNEDELKLVCQDLITSTLKCSNEFIKYFHYKLLHSQEYLSTPFETRKKLAHDISQKFPFANTGGKVIFDEIINDRLILEDYCNHLLKRSLQITNDEVKTLHAKLHNSRSQDFDLHCLHHKLAFALYEEFSFLKAEYPFPTVFLKIATNNNIEKLQSFIDEVYSYWETLYDTLESQKKKDLTKLVVPEFYHLRQKRIIQDLHKPGLKFFKNIFNPLNLIVNDSTIGIKNNDNLTKNNNNLTKWLNNQNFKNELNRYKERRKMQQILLKHYLRFSEVKAFIIQEGKLSSASSNQKILDELERLTKDYYNTDETGQPYIKFEDLPDDEDDNSKLLPEDLTPITYSSTYSQFGIVLNPTIAEAPTNQSLLTLNTNNSTSENKEIKSSSNKETTYNMLPTAEFSDEGKKDETISDFTPP